MGGGCAIPLQFDSYGALQRLRVVGWGIGCNRRAVPEVVTWHSSQIVTNAAAQDLPGTGLRGKRADHLR
jgi:hypothetical protein